MLTTLSRVLAGGAVQYAAHSAISRRRFSNRSPRPICSLHLVPDCVRERHFDNFYAAQRTRARTRGDGGGEGIAATVHK
jgi:hypothetical protein